MTVIEIADDQAARLKAKASAQGLTLKAWIEKLAEESPEGALQKPLKTGRGMLAKYGPAPSAEEIDENRREMFRGFAQDFLDDRRCCRYAHGLVSNLYDVTSLSKAAGDFIDHAAAAANQIVVSSITLAEIVYLIEKNRLPASAYTDLKAAIDDPGHVFKEAALTADS